MLHIRLTMEDSVPRTSSPAVRLPGSATAAGYPVRPGPSRWGAAWLIAVAAAFTAAEFAFTVGRRSLSWDEIVYITQVSGHAHAAPFTAPRSRGISLLVAPLTLVSSSTYALRAYLAVLAGLALLGGLWLWRRVLPDRVLVIAGLLLGGLWIVQYYGPQAMPDLWVALSSLAALAFFVRATRYHRWPDLAGLAGCIAIAALMRLNDAVFLALPLVVAAVAIRPWRRWQPVAAVVGGLAAGSLEWVIEAYVRFGGISRRLHGSVSMQGGLGAHVGFWDELRALNGPVICRRDCSIGWHDQVLSIWWLAVPLLVVLGVVAARRAGRGGPAAIAAVTGLSLASQYLVLINYAAPRFLIPGYALLALPVAEAADWLLRRRHQPARIAAAAAVCAVLAAQIVSQHQVLTRNAGASDDSPALAAELNKLGVQAPCVISGKGFIPVAYYAGCESAAPPVRAGRGVSVAVLLGARTAVPAYAAGWRRVHLNHHALVAYVRVPGHRHALLQIRKRPAGLGA